jgi:hypothetical protein
MVASKAGTVSEYLKSLPPERRGQIEKVRSVIKRNLPRGYVEAMQYGMIGYAVPLSRYPVTYNKQPLALAALASQKGYCSLYLMSIYSSPALKSWFEAAFAKAGKKLDMGKSCVRFKTVDDLPLDVIGKAISKVGVDEFIATYEKARSKTAKRPAKG